MRDIVTPLSVVVLGAISVTAIIAACAWGWTNVSDSPSVIAELGLFSCSAVALGWSLPKLLKP